MSVRALVHLPATVVRGEPFEVRTTLAHPMETGYRRDSDGTLLPRDIVRRMEVRFEGARVFAAELYPAMSANPYVAFWLRVDSAGTLEITWTGDRGFRHVEARPLTPA